jgi:hypothetical protein
LIGGAKRINPIDLPPVLACFGIKLGDKELGVLAPL